MNATHTPLKIEAGKCYQMRCGVVVGPIQLSKSSPKFPWVCLGLCWREDGSFSKYGPHARDLVAQVYVSDTPPDAPLPDIITDQPCKNLRDEFAIAIVAAFLSRPLSDNELTLEQCQIVWANADAMMKARKK